MWLWNRKIEFSDPKAVGPKGYRIEVQRQSGFLTFWNYEVYDVTGKKVLHGQVGACHDPKQAVQEATKIAKLHLLKEIDPQNFGLL